MRFEDYMRSSVIRLNQEEVEYLQVLLRIMKSKENPYQKVHTKLKEKLKNAERSLR